MDDNTGVEDGERIKEEDEDKGVGPLGRERLG